MNVPANDDAHQVSGNATAVSGTVGSGEHIYFRIGLTSTNTGDPRYGRIILRYNNNTKYQFLYIRQGEEADYVFRKTDNAPSGTYTGARSLAVKFSPYNLTNTEITESTTTGVATGVATIPGTYKGDFVDYPTQVGAFFQWAGTTSKETFAYHPTNPASAVIGWQQSPYSNTYWDALKTTHETCPYGWRRPKSGITDNVATSNASASELIQSLFYATLNGESSNTNSSNYRYWGYYADGYFDRRLITYQNSNYPNTAVSPNTKDVAYIGVLYTNPDSGASMFLPAGGYRYDSDGTLNYYENGGFYWSSSSSNSNTSWALHIQSDVAFQKLNYYSYGFAVRCVKE
jgi:hypothetical protein